MCGTLVVPGTPVELGDLKAEPELESESLCEVAGVKANGSDGVDLLSTTSTGLSRSVLEELCSGGSHQGQQEDACAGAEPAAEQPHWLLLPPLQEASDLGGPAELLQAELATEPLEKPVVDVVDPPMCAQSSDPMHAGSLRHDWSCVFDTSAPPEPPTTRSPWTWSSATDVASGEGAQVRQPILISQRGSAKPPAGFLGCSSLRRGCARDAGSDDEAEGIADVEPVI